jgi:hypothetical protein
MLRAREENFGGRRWGAGERGSSTVFESSSCKSSGWHVARLLGHVGELEVAAAAPLTRCESSGRHVVRLLGHAGELEVAAAVPLMQ